MILALIAHTAMAIASGLALWPMLRVQRMRLADVAAPIYSEVPIITFDSRGLA